MEEGGKRKRKRERRVAYVLVVVLIGKVRFPNSPAHSLDAVEEEDADEEGFKAPAALFALETSFQVDQDDFADRGGTVLGRGAELRGDNHGYEWSGRRRRISWKDITRVFQYTGVGLFLSFLFVGLLDSRGVGDQMPVVRAADYDLSEGPEVKGLGEECVLHSWMGS